VPPQYPPYSRYGIRLFVPILLLLAVPLPRLCMAEARISAEGRVNTGWEYDDNVFESSSGKATGGAAVASLFTILKINTPAALTVLNYNLGYKDHHRLAGSDQPVAGDVLVNRLSAVGRRKLGADWSAGYGGDLKLRNVFDKNQLNLLSEEGYVRGSGHLSATRRSLVGAADLRLVYRLAVCDFQTFHTFDYVSHSPGCRLSRRLGRGRSLSAGYNYTRRSFERRINVPDGSGGLIRGDSRQIDNLHQFELGFSYTQGMLFNVSWALQRNDSNNYGFSYWNNRFTILLADRLPGKLFFNAYIFFELKRYSDETGQPLLVDILTEENDNNGAVIKLSRALSKTLEASVTASLYRNESSIRELNFRKNVIATSLTVRF
jgi:hypothetical protein